MTPTIFRLRVCFWLAGWSAVPGGAMAQGAFQTITFVANAENQTKPRVRYTGHAWVADQGGFLAGTGRGHRLLTEVAPEDVACW